MIFKILTLFPEIFPGPLNHSITGRALVEKKFEIEAINIREFSKNKSKTVDDKPYGGGAGMIFKPDILQRSLNFAKKKARKKTKIIMLSANGRKFDQKFAKETIKNDELIIIETQTGSYFGEDDIVRLDDPYGRI